jgi:hypothetical protein
MSTGNGRNFFSGRFNRISRTPGRDVALDEPILGKSIVWFTRHAIDRMKQRGVSEAEVIRVLAAPTQKGLPTQPNRRRWRRSRSARNHVDIVFEIWPDKICIVTVILVN